MSADAGASAAKLLPAAAKANAHVFFDDGRERTAGEVIDSFKKTIGAAREILAETAGRIEKGLSGEIGARLNAIFDAPSGARETGRSAPFLETKGLSLFAIALLQALDPRELAPGGDRSGHDRSQNERSRNDRE